MISTEKCRLHCGHCNHIWTAETLTGVSIEVWLAHVKSIRCPECKAGSDWLGLVKDEAALRALLEARDKGE